MSSLRTGKYLSPDADRTRRNKYLLHSVLVHSGRIGGGNHHAYIRPDLHGQWYKFDDAHVTRVTASRAVNDQFGGEGATPGAQLPETTSNAFSLVYVRESDLHEMLLVRTLTHAIDIRLATVESLRTQMEENQFLDLVDDEKCRSFQVENPQTPFVDFKCQVAAELGVPVERQRYWSWAKRQNGTYRPFRVLTAQEEAQTVLQLQQSIFKALGLRKRQWVPILLFLEVVTENEVAAWAANPWLQLFAHDAHGGVGDGHAGLSPPPIPKSHILLFLKFYDPRTEILEFVGHLLLHRESRLSEHRDAVMRLAADRLCPGQDFVLYEEIKLDPSVFCEEKDWEGQLGSDLQLGNGDILCIQPVIGPYEVGTGVEVPYRAVPEFLEYIRRQRVVFRELAHPSDDKVTLELTRTTPYDDVIAALAVALGVADPKTLRLTVHNSSRQDPELPLLKHRGVRCLSDMHLHNSNHTLSDMLPPILDHAAIAANNILYYEVLGIIPLAELERLTLLVTGLPRPPLPSLS